MLTVNAQGGQRHLGLARLAVAQGNGDKLLKPRMKGCKDGFAGGGHAILSALDEILDGPGRVRPVVFRAFQNASSD